MFACDFRKAFDTVNWSMIHEALERFGFGPYFSDLVRLIYSNIETALLNRGFTSRYFKPARGVRQGCCLSPYLFILVAEILAIQIREDPTIQGIKTPNRELKVTLFADDLTGFAQDQESLVNMINLIEQFGERSDCVSTGKNQRSCQPVLPQ